MAPSSPSEPDAPLTVADLAVLCDRFRNSTPVRATTAHGTHVFNVVAVEQDDRGRMLLRLQTDEQVAP